MSKSSRRAPRVAFACGLVVVLVGLLVGPRLAAEVAARAAQRTHDAAGLTAWQSRERANQVMRDTAAVAGLDVHLWMPWVVAMPCERVGGRTGVSYPLDSLMHDGSVDRVAVAARIAAYWRSIGYTVDGPKATTQSPTPDIVSVYATTPDGAGITVSVDLRTTTFMGESACALVAGGPTPLPTPTLLPVGPGVSAWVSTGATP